MISLTPDFVVNHVKFHTQIIQSSTAGISDAAACTAPVSGNCLNWNVGHILALRDDIIEILGGKRVYPKAMFARYITESEPIVAPGSGETPLSQLLPLIEPQAEVYLSLLQAGTAESYAQPSPRGDGVMMTLGEKLFILAFFHETYHAFQLEHARHAAANHAS